MMQGRADKSGAGSQKREPIAHAVSEGAVSQLGAHVGGRTAARETLYEGRGFEAPTGGSQVHKCGSQGRHK